MQTNMKDIDSIATNDTGMELTCYLHPGWQPLIRPAPMRRDWMDHTPESFAYRCLPLNIANAHGWEILSPCAFSAIWNGGTDIGAVTITPGPGQPQQGMPVSLFGQGVLTFHIEGIFRTPPGWDLWVGGAPNRAKDGIAPLTGIIETDWSPFTFTMNWRFTRPGHLVHFDALEPICFLFPIERAAIERFAPKFEPLHADPATQERFEAWSRERDAFHQRMAANPPRTPADRWQKHYYRGMDVAGRSVAAGHRTKLRLPRFDSSRAPGLALAPEEDAERPKRSPAPASDETAHLRLALAKREWLLETIERQRDLVPKLVILDRISGLTRDAFLERFYAANRPVILTNEMTNWPALTRWTPDYLKTALSGRIIEFQDERAQNEKFELQKEAHRREATFDVFLERILQLGAGNNAYITAYNSARNAATFSVLHADIGHLDKFLDRRAESPHGMMWIGPAGTVTPLHHDLTNNFIAQIIGRKRIRLMPAADIGKLYNHQHVFSDIPDLDDPGIDRHRHPRLSALRSYDILLEPGEILFVPIGWWHQVKSIDFSVTITYTNFLWRNDAHADYPTG